MRRLQDLRCILMDRLNPPYLALAAGAVVVMGLVLAILLFATSNRGQTAFSIPLGADFAGFYVAGEILNRGQASQLYDRTLHNQLYHELLPAEDVKAAIPYVHPPFVAGLMRLLAVLPYSTAFGIWLVLTGVLYVAAWRLLLKTIPWPDQRQNGLIILLAASFEPFLFECWLGGQLSVMAFGSFAICFAALQFDRPVAAGMALGFCFYKPTLLLIVLPLLLIGRCWRILLGLLVTGLGLAVLSLLLAGWDVSVGYLNVLLAFSHSTSGGDLEIRTWKYVDFNNCLRLMFGGSSTLQRILFVLVSLVPLVFLASCWRFYHRIEPDSRRLLWATTVTWIPLLNLYFGIYDSILILQSLVITAALLCRRSQLPNPLQRSGFAELSFAIAIVPWFSQNLAARTGVPLYSLLMTVFGCCQLYHLCRLHPEFAPFSRRRK